MSDIVEKLRDIAQRNAWLALCSDAADEIETWRKAFVAQALEKDELKSEIERLREELLSRHNDQRAKAEEIERLRGLLREYADVVRLVREGKPVPLAYLEDRIREALGDE